MGSSIVLLGNQLAMPRQQSLGRDNGGELVRHVSLRRLARVDQEISAETTHSENGIGDGARVIIHAEGVRLVFHPS